MITNRLVLATFAQVAIVVYFDACPAYADGGFTYSSPQSKEIIEERARGVITALRDRHMNRLAAFVHPTIGLQFSPYAHASSGDQTFSREQVRRLGTTDPKYRWGNYDGSGDQIRLSWREYFHKFVYSRNFSEASTVNYNKVRQRGNTLNNLRQHYPGSIVVEYFTPDPDEKDGLDWQSLWLVFQPRATTWYLVGIAHDQWTI